MTAQSDNTDLPSDRASANRLNGLRAAVLGANDGIVSTSSVVMGVAGATSDHHSIVVAGLAALVAGALSMAVGEYVSVSSQSDAEKAFIRQEKHWLRTRPQAELAQLAGEYEKLGVSKKTSLKVAQELTASNPLRAHLRAHFNLDPDDVNSPVLAAIASLVAFTIGGLVPFLAVVFAPESFRLGATLTAVGFALIVTGHLSATAGNASKLRAIARVLAGGLVAMLVTYAIGSIFGTVA